MGTSRQPRHRSPAFAQEISIGPLQRRRFRATERRRRAQIVREFDSGFARPRGKIHRGWESAIQRHLRSSRPRPRRRGARAGAGPESAIDDFTRSPGVAELRDKTDAARIMIDRRIVATTRHSSLMRGGAENVQLTISMASIDILTGRGVARVRRPERGIGESLRA